MSVLRFDNLTRAVLNIAGTLRVVLNSSSSANSFTVPVQYNLRAHRMRETFYHVAARPPDARRCSDRDSTHVEPHPGAVSAPRLLYSNQREDGESNLRVETSQRFALESRRRKLPLFRFLILHAWLKVIVKMMKMKMC